MTAELMNFSVGTKLLKTSETQIDKNLFKVF